jgi:hypothetical protein
MSLFASFATDDDSSGSLWGNDGGGGLFSNPLQDLLDSGNFTLQDVLTQQTLIQEVRNLNESLIKYLKDNVKSLVELIVSEEGQNITNENDASVGNELLASSASEIFACDVSEINDELTADENLNILFSVLNRDTLNARTAGNFYKCMLSICKESDERRATLLTYLSTKEKELLNKFIQHMSVDSIAASFRLLLEASDLKPSESSDNDGNPKDINSDENTATNAPEENTSSTSFPKPFWPANNIVKSLLQTLHDQGKSQTAYTNIAETLIDAIARSTYTPPATSSFNFSRSDVMDLNEIAQQQQQEMQRQSIQQTPMMNALTGQIQHVLDALPNRGAFFVITRLLEECGILQQQQQQQQMRSNEDTTNENSNNNSNSSGKNELNISELVLAVENKMADVLSMITSTNTGEGKMTTNMKFYKPFGIERLLAVELLSVFAALKPGSVSDEACVEIFNLMEIHPLHNILHSAISRMIIERGVKTNAIVEKIVAFFDRDENYISLEMAYGGHYLDMARALNIESDGITKVSKVWETELGNMVLPSSLNNNNNNSNGIGLNNSDPQRGTGELEYDMNNDDDDSDDSDDDDDDDDDDIDDDALRQRYGWGGDDDDADNSNSNSANDSNTVNNNNEDGVGFAAFGNNNANDDTTVEDISFDAFGNNNSNSSNASGTTEQEMSFAAFGNDAGDDDDEVKFE